MNTQPYYQVWCVQWMRPDSSLQLQELLNEMDAEGYEIDRLTPVTHWPVQLGVNGQVEIVVIFRNKPSSPEQRYEEKRT